MLSTTHKNMYHRLVVTREIITDGKQQGQVLSDITGILSLELTVNSRCEPGSNFYKAADMEINRRREPGSNFYKVADMEMFQK